ncbi:hypothetical protein BJV77DRAFT_1059733 [Russula vinacea]|nr:hypothetical protein BJV77DRAFT_1059733 [Russula vinacea]
MTDLTILHAPSTLSLPDTKETGLRFAFNRRSLTPRPLISTPMVTVQMVETDSPPPSPVGFQDHSLLSPPRRSFRSKDSHRVTRTRPSSAPPGKSRTISPHDHFPSRPKSPDFVSGSHSSIPIVVRPETTLFRPKPFWRNTPRSAVSGTFYASSLHLIRRSTFIAAGLRFDKPIADLSALGVESRIGIVVLLPDSPP